MNNRLIGIAGAVQQHPIDQTKLGYLFLNERTWNNK